MARLFVPLSAETFGHHEVTLADGVSIEKQLAAIGRDIVGRALSIDYMWGGRDNRIIIAKPLDNSGYAASALARSIYEERQITDSDARYDIYDQDQPVISDNLTPPEKGA